MKKYEAPEIEVMNVRVEKGFNGSNSGNGGSFTPDNNGTITQGPSANDAFGTSPMFN